MVGPAADAGAVSAPARARIVPPAATMVAAVAHGARRVHQRARNAAYVLAIELLAAAQGVALRGGDIAAGTRAVQDAVRSSSAFLDQDRALSGDIETLGALVLRGEYNAHGRIDLAESAAS